ncbi:erythromycin esterase family protein [Streptomyces albipurpureus]|uniref:Erythromycin esterase family protein n=1 Tax=Streptomyces albipurpureus TaxID=2897419 RepID=A0ABT0UY29_9ACTN|nr:erythromycin esterase family protein [Streptomyces sp. CWNU-1]MCM2392066.1 erythromycin esterase family protein [Streptomyces sp. CWNU-1]
MDTSADSSSDAFAWPLGQSAGPAEIGALRELIGDARVVALGEGAHNITEFYGLRDQLFRLLVQEFGFTGLVLESGFPEGLAVNEWIHGGPGRIETIARDGITYRFGESEPTRRQLRWMRHRNTGDFAKVGFYGMDLPGSSTSPGPAVRACLERLPARPGDEELLRLSDLGGRSHAALRYAAMSASDRARLLEGLQGLQERALRFSHKDGVDREHSEDAEVALWCAASLGAFVAEVEGAGSTFPTGRPYPREAFMARSVEWVLQRERRVMVSAHNAHVRRSPFHGRPTLGGLLDSALGADLVVIGMTYGSGPEIRFTQRSPRPFDCEVTLGARTLTPESVESRLDRLGPRVAVVDPRRAPGGFLDGVEGTLASGGLDPVDDFPAAYDALIHVRRVTRVPGAFERLRAEFDAAARSAPEAAAEVDAGTNTGTEAGTNTGTEAAAAADSDAGPDSEAEAEAEQSARSGDLGGPEATEESESP